MPVDLANSKNLAGFALLPLASRETFQAEDGDIVDESIALFRPNAYFRTFEIRGPADRTLAYLLLFIGDCLAKLKPGQSKADSYKTLSLWASSGFAIPGDASFPSNLKSLFSEAAGKQDSDTLREYLGKARIMTLQRLLSVVYEQQQKDSEPSQWWMCFQKRKFMGKTLA